MVQLSKLIILSILMLSILLVGCSRYTEVNTNTCISEVYISSYNNITSYSYVCYINSTNSKVIRIHTIISEIESFK